MVPLCSVKRLSQFSVAGLFVSGHAPPEVRREPSFEAAHGLVVGLALGDLGVVVAAASAGPHPDLGDSDEMDRRVEPAITTARKTVNNTIPLEASIGAANSHKTLATSPT